MTAIINFDEALKASDGKERGLLLGNGFSIRHFSYKTLLEKSGLDERGPLRALFTALRTVDFELVIKALEDAVLVETVYNKIKRADLFRDDADKIRRALVHSIRQIHPGHREDIAPVIPACIDLLSSFSKIFTLNYDLLLYWVILENTKKFQDGFGLGKEKNGFLTPFKVDAYCNVFNLHGGLHLFRTPDDEVEKRLMGSSGVIDAIAETITKDKRLPVYVAEGTSTAKLARIYALPYLRHCYEMLHASKGIFFVYGHSASPNDAHIYKAIFTSEVDHLYFCIHKPTADIQAIDGELARYKKLYASKIDYIFVDSETANVWG